MPRRVRRPRLILFSCPMKVPLIKLHRQIAGTIVPKDHFRQSSASTGRTFNAHFIVSTNPARCAGIAPLVRRLSGGVRSDILVRPTQTIHFRPSPMHVLHVLRARMVRIRSDSNAPSACLATSASGQRRRLCQQIGSQKTDIAVQRARSVPRAVSRAKSFATLIFIAAHDRLQVQPAVLKKFFARQARQIRMKATTTRVPASHAKLIFTPNQPVRLTANSALRLAVLELAARHIARASASIVPFKPLAFVRANQGTNGTTRRASKREPTTERWIASQRFMKDASTTTFGITLARAQLKMTAHLNAASREARLTQRQASACATVYKRLRKFATGTAGPSRRQFTTTRFWEHLTLLEAMARQPQSAQPISTGSSDRSFAHMPRATSCP